MSAKTYDLRSKMKIGLEIHFQVSGRKLFCRCPTESHGSEIFRFSRKLVATSSEMGSIDKAARYEMERNLSAEYSATDNSCLVEYDEEPPHAVDRKAMDAAVIASLALKSKVLEDIFFMRKVVVDGSNTSGFQRTAIISMNGSISTSRGDVRVTSVCLEEDSARLLEAEKGVNLFSLDRLGIPLIEIATEPDIIDEDHAVETARAIGYFVQATGLTRMTVDAIRQDVNVSFGFGRVEIKGVQKLSLIPDVIRYELERQEALLEISHRTQQYLEYYRISPKISDLTELLSNTSSRIISQNISSGNRVYGCPLKGMAGLMKSGSFRMGKEISDLVKRYGIKGLFHSDELPDYGITAEEAERVYNILNKGREDAAIIISCPEKMKEMLFQEIFRRISKLISMDLTETRFPTDEGTTGFLRPMPGRERMYPETDIPVISLNRSYIEEMSGKVPESPEEKIGEISSKYGISKQDSMVLVNTFRSNDFEEICSLIGNPKISARLLLQTIPELEKKYKSTVQMNELYKLLRIAGERGWIRDVIERAIEIMLSKKKLAVDIIGMEEITPMSMDDIVSVLRKIISETPGKVSEKNIVAKIKMVTGRPFNPSDVISAYRALKDRYLP
ncbi:MAG: Glu-tRNA(Gln) amidotransferase subunit GatE [Thermoplasmataceae archaeon]